MIALAAVVSASEEKKWPPVMTVAADKVYVALRVVSEMEVGAYNM